jgi:hypothetical protein
MINAIRVIRAAFVGVASIMAVAKAITVSIMRDTSIGIKTVTSTDRDVMHDAVNAVALFVVEAYPIVTVYPLGHSSGVALQHSTNAVVETGRDDHRSRVSRRNFLCIYCNPSGAKVVIVVVFVVFVVCVATADCVSMQVVHDIPT